MENDRFGEVGFIRYHGDGVGKGVIEARAAGSALIGLDESLRYFNSRQFKDLVAIDYQIPVKTSEGSWVVIVLGGLGVGASTFALSYLKKAGEKMAENDFKDVGLKDVIAKSLDAIGKFIELVKLTGRRSSWERDEFKVDADKACVRVIGHNGGVIEIPIRYIDWYQKMPPKLFDKMISPVVKGRELEVGVEKEGRIELATVSVVDKALFVYEEEEDEEDFLFPELVHGDEVRIEGKLIRGNEKSNSIGVEYDGHYINCIPEYGKITRFKSALFLRCVVEGAINRHMKKRKVADRRPTIVIRNIQPLESDKQVDLF
ncbi:hypothetical protein [Chromobacterium violaceum]|uniref:hypothetical protein n=1 Tax=Chromobacterium violaceum TaxID=536 RepID=UPI003DA9456A